MKIIEVIKHPHADAEKDELTKQGKKQCKILKKMIDFSQYKKIYSSPAKRCIQCCQLLRLNFEICPGLANAPAEKTKVYDKIAKETGNYGVYFEVKELEPVLKQVGEIFIKALQEIARKINDGEKALAISHGGSIVPALKLVDEKFSLANIGGRIKDAQRLEFYIERNKIFNYRVFPCNL